MTNFATIEDFAKTIKRGTFGLYVGTITEPKMNVFPCDTRDKTQRNPYIGRVQSISIYQNAATGVNYYSIVKSECKREGIEFTDAEFAARFPKEKTYTEEVNGLGGIIYEHEVSGQRYLRLYKGRKPTKVQYFTLCDGKLVEKGSNLEKDILRYMPSKSGSKKQEDLGIQNIVEVRQPKVENVAFLKQGDRQYINKRFNINDFVLEHLSKIF